MCANASVLSWCQARGCEVVLLRYRDKKEWKKYDRQKKIAPLKGLAAALDVAAWGANHDSKDSSVFGAVDRGKFNKVLYCSSDGETAWLKLQCFPHL